MSRHRTFCTTFGYPGISTSSSTPSENSRPEPFQPTGRAPISATVDPNTIFGQNELEAVASFNDIINLARLRDEILNTAIFVHQTPARPDRRFLYSLMPSSRRALRLQLPSRRVQRARQRVCGCGCTTPSRHRWCCLCIPSPIHQRCWAS
jgi:hypothetical protein